MAAPLARPHAADGSFGAGRPDYLLCGPFLPYGFRATGARGRVMRYIIGRIWTRPGKRDE